MLSDIIASSALDVADVAVWSRVRAISGILAVICLLGLDQYILRHPETVRQIRRILFVQIPAAALAAALIGQVFSQPALMIILIATFSSVAVAVSQFHRSRGRLVSAQMAAQSWKVIFLLGIAYYAWNQTSIRFEFLIVICAILSLAGLLFIALMNAPHSIEVDEQREPRNLRDIYGTSVRLMAISALTTLSLYLEQLAVNIFGNDHSAAIYFTHATYFLFSASLFNGYIAFLAIPWAKKNPERFERIMSKWMWPSVILGVVYVIAIQALAAIAWLIMTPTVGRIDLAILSAFSISAWSRTIYTYPSAYFGAFGERKQYTTIAARYTFSLAVASVTFLALWWGVGLSLVYSVAWASAGNWLLRTVIGLHLAKAISLEKAIS